MDYFLAVYDTDMFNRNLNLYYRIWLNSYLFLNIIVIWNEAFNNYSTADMIKFLTDAEAAPWFSVTLMHNVIKYDCAKRNSCCFCPVF